MSPNSSLPSPGHEQGRSQTARLHRWLLALVFLTVGALAACDTEIPAPPQITVVITTVNDQQALQQGINEALTGTAVVNDALTATALARKGSTVTPSVTPTPSLTPTLTPTRFVTLTRTPVPSDTPTPTFAPYASNTPAPALEVNNGWLRVINAWRDPRGSSATDLVNVLLNNQQIHSSLAYGEKTNYLQVLPGAVNISLRLAKEIITGTPTPPLISRVVNVPAGAIVSVLAVDQGAGLELLPLTEDPSPLVSGTSRLTVFQANPVLMPVNALIADIQRALAYQLKSGDLVGPLDMPTGTYEVELYDAVQPDQYVAGLPEIQLVNRVSYLLILLAPASSAEGATSSLLVSGLTRRISTDVMARFINVATQTGPLSLTLDGQVALPSLAVGSISNALPAPAFGARLGLVDSSGETVATSDLGPWPADQLNTNKLVLIYDSEQGPVVSTLAQDASPTAINANIRLIHLLPETRPLTLEVRSVRAVAAAGAAAGATEVPWTAVGQAEFGAASSYERRTPDVYDVRVVLSGSRSVIAELPPTQLLASGVYDIVVMPGEEQGSVQMRLVQPDVQLSGAQTGEGNATAVFEAVAATLTAAAPQAATATPTRISTATATRTPIPTNTPRPSSTPSLPTPILIVDPQPPDTTTGIVNLFGQHFAAGQQYIVTVDRGLEPIFNGRVNPDGTITDSVQLPENLTPGLHILQVCVDCRPRGAQQAAPVVIVVADPRVTATPTPSS